MDNGGGEAARSSELGIPGAAVQGRSEANISTGTFHAQLGPAAAARRFSFDGFFEPSAAAYHVGLRLPGRVVPVHDYSYFYPALQPRPFGGPGVVLAALLPGGGGGAAYNGDYALHLRPGAGHGEVPVNLLPDDAGHGEAFVGQLPGGAVAAYDDDYGAYLALQLRPGAGRGEVFIGPLPDGVVGAVFDNSSNFVQNTVPLPGNERAADGIAGNDGEAYNNLGMVAERLHHLLPFVGIGACSVAVNGLAAGPGSPAVAFHLFALLLGGLLLVILHVLRV